MPLGSVEIKRGEKQFYRDTKVDVLLGRENTNTWLFYE
jgi:hypothetical protein